MLLVDKVLMKYAQKSWYWIALIVVLRLAVLEAMTQFAWLLGLALTAIQAPSLKTMIISCLGLAIVLLLSSFIQGELKYRVQVKTRTILREEVMVKILKLDSGQVEQLGPTSSSTTALDAVEMVLPYVSVYVPSLLYSFIAPLCVFFEIKIHHAGIAWILLLVSWVLLPLHNVFRKNIEQLRKRYWNSLERMTRSYLDGLRGMTTLKIYQQVQAHQRKLERYSDELSQDINAFMKINFSSFFITEGMMYACLTVVVWLTIRSSLSLSQQLSMLLLGFAYFASVRELMSATHDALTAISASDKLDTILKLSTTKEKQAISRIEKEGWVFRQISFSYPEKEQVIHDFNLEIQPGEMVALVGLSGCGKSTVASLALRFLEPNQGMLFIDGISYSGISEEMLRQKIAMVPQTVHIFSGNVRDNLVIAKKEASDSELYEVLKKVGLCSLNLEDEVGDNGGRLSGGQKQKIGIARALLTEAKYLVFDEATSAVDPQSEAEIWQIIQSLVRQKTLLVISHRLSTIQQADRIVVMKQGGIEEMGTHEELMSHNGLYASLVFKQASLEAEVVQ